MLAEVNLDPGQSLTLFPRDFCLATTEEYIRVPDDLVARVEGKSSLGRLGLTCHATAGFIDPGFEGRITLELYNMNPNPIVLRPGRAICQLSFMTLTEPAERPYGHPDLGSKYQGQKTTQESLYDG
jgi:dCTP deaminase